MTIPPRSISPIHSRLKLSYQRFQSSVFASALIAGVGLLPNLGQAQNFQNFQNQIRQGKTLEAARELHQLNQSLNEKSPQLLEARYWLGVALHESKFEQLAALQFVDVIRRGPSRFLKSSLERLSQIADVSGDEGLLNYALGRIKPQEVPEGQKDKIWIRMGERHLRQAAFSQAEQVFSGIGASSKLFFRAQFNRGLSLLESNKPREAVAVYQNLLQLRQKSAVTDPERISATMGLARALYQAQEWQKSIETYSRIPKDSYAWNDSIFESSWAYFRAAKFRSALGQFHTLHSPYYEDYFQPESLILRSLVYLYICQYDEMEKTLAFFEKTYLPIKQKLERFLKQNQDPVLFADEIVKEFRSQGILPRAVLRHLAKEGDVREQSDYLKKVLEEKSRLESVSVWNRSSLQNYGRKALESRARTARKALGELVKVRLQFLVTDLEDLNEQASFARYEMIGGRKEQIKKRIAGESPKTLDENVSRGFYVQNGFEYWPFKGEYWINELGNYKYVGTARCQ